MLKLLTNLSNLKLYDPYNNVSAHFKWNKFLNSINTIETIQMINNILENQHSNRKPQFLVTGSLILNWFLLPNKS